MIYPPMRATTVQGSACLSAVEATPSQARKEHVSDYTDDHTTPVADAVNAGQQQLLPWPRHTIRARNSHSSYEGASDTVGLGGNQTAGTAGGGRGSGGARPTKDVDDIAPFNFVYVGRLASDKCPGLLLHAFSYILNHQLAQTSPATSSASADTSADTAAAAAAARSGSYLRTAAGISADLPPRPPAFLLNSAEQLGAFRRSARLTLYGAGPLRGALQRLAEELGIAPWVSFAGHLPSAELVCRLGGGGGGGGGIAGGGSIDCAGHSMSHNGSADIVGGDACPNCGAAGAGAGAADVLVNPIVAGETFGFVHLEAAALGLPVVAFRAAANAESVQTGLLVEYALGSAVHDLAHALMLVFQQRRNGLFSAQGTCDAARAAYRHWNTQRHSLALVNALERLLASLQP